MSTLLSVGGIAISGAVGCYLLEMIGQKHVSMALGFTVYVFLIITVMRFCLDHAHKIINMFGGLPI